MEEGSSTPSDLLENQQKLSQKRAQIQRSIATAMSSWQPAAETLVRPRQVSDYESAEQDQAQTDSRDEPTLVEIEQEYSRSAGERPPLPGQFSEPRSVSKSHEGDAASESTRSAARILPIPARTPATSGRSRLLIIGSGVLICLLAIGGMGLFWRVQPSPGVSPTPSRPRALATKAVQQATPAPTPTPSLAPTAPPTPTPTKKAKTVEVAPSVFLSFEDDSTGGWHSSAQDGTIESIKNVDTSRAYDGDHVLQVSYDSDDDHSYPCVGTSYFPAPLKAGATISVSLLKRKGSRVQATLYVADKVGKWSVASTSAFLEDTNVWYRTSFRVPSTFKGPATQVGIVLFGDDATIYIDALRW